MSELGIDIGGSSVKLALMQGTDSPWQAQSTVYALPTRDQLVQVIRETLPRELNHIRAVGLCVPGRRDAEGRTVILSLNLPSLNGLRLDGLVRDAVGEVEQLSIHGDATAAAYDIYATRQLRGRLLLLALGTGVGAAVLDDGAPLRVDGDSPGHIGQIDCSIDGEPVIGPDGGAGSLEGYIGAPALRLRYGNDVAGALRQLGPDDPPLRALARAIRICHAVYCPENVVVTGGIGNRLSHILPVLRQLVETNLTRLARTGWTLSCGDDDFHAARGVARLAAKPASRDPPSP